MNAVESNTVSYAQADPLAATAAPTAPWQVNTVRIMDEAGRVVAAAGRNPEAHHVATPGMSALVQH